MLHSIFAVHFEPCRQVDEVDQHRVDKVGFTVTVLWNESELRESWT